MPGGIAKAGFKRHVRASKHTVDVLYPPRRVPAAGTTPTGTAPSTPLTGPRETVAVAPPSPVPARPAVLGLQCLWYDQAQDVNQGAAASETRRFPVSGWRQGTVAVAAFWLADVVRTAGELTGKTVFSDCDVVVHLGRRYHVLGFDVSGSGSELPYVGYLWLGSAEGQ